MKPPLISEFRLKCLDDPSEGYILKCLDRALQQITSVLCPHLLPPQFPEPGSLVLLGAGPVGISILKLKSKLLSVTCSESGATPC